MKLYEFTRSKNGKKVYIRDSAITAVSFDDGETSIFTVGDPVPFTVKESIGEVLRTITETP
ncbi:hypothetical protein DVH26_07725 [Paenibacillus sp. H1-7]|uniref:hypothetical protein n=1 Tax=Paenibacillus sp. H1-7 TaxID=2282849 RepID=UPI001EF79DE0|nr:hypothetical protein [Paenibacillus sp. H1-7]ULL14347.1 hypothetical protein DVH26_07725 [Paenibacillus sp. H1-7]